MGFFDRFFKTREGPQARYDDDVLGPLGWSDDAEGWEGEYAGLDFVVAYERGVSPAPELLAHAKAVLADAGALKSKIEHAKTAATAANPSLAAEIAALQLESIYFYTHKAVRRIMADLSGGKCGRSWRVEFREQECEGIGFDT